MRGFIHKMICLFAICCMIAPAAGAQALTVQEGEQHYRQGDYYKAIDALEQAMSRRPAGEQAHLMLISSYLETGRNAVAEEKAMNAMERFPEIPAFRWLRAEALLHQRRFEEALVEYHAVDDALNKDESLNPLEAGSHEVQLRLGQVRQALAGRAYQKGEFDEAMHQMKAASEHLSDSVQVHKNLISLYLESEDPDQAIRAADRAIEQFPEETDFLRMKATAYYRKEDTEAVREQFKKIYDKNPDNVENGLVYAELLVAGQHSNKAMAVLEHLQEENPGERRIYQMMTELYERRFDTEGKRIVLRQMQKQFPEDPDVMEQIAATYESENMMNHARAVYDSLAVMTGKDLKFGLAKAETFRTRDSLRAAANIYRELRGKYPDKPELLFNEGRNFENMNRWSDASQVYAEWVKLSGERQTEARVRHGVTSMKAGHEQQAMHQLEKAVEQGTDNSEAYLYLSQLKRQNGDQDVAFELALKALQMSLTQMARQQQNIEAQIQEEGIYSQAVNDEKLQEIDNTNQLAKETFNWLTQEFSREKVEPVMEELAEKYHTSGRLFYMMGTYYKNNREEETARNYLQKAIQFSPRQTNAHLALAELFEERGEISKAIEAYEKAGGLGPEHPEPYSALIRLYRDQGKLDQLIDRWLARYRAKPNNEALKNHLIEALHKADRFEEARELLDRE